MKRFLHLKLGALTFIDSLTQEKSRRALQPVVDSLANLLESGIPLRTALMHLWDSRLPRNQKYYVSLAREGLEQGKSLSESWSQHGSGVFLALLQAGERSGNLPTVLNSWLRQQERREQFRGELTRLFAYPLVLLTATVALSFFIANVVFPSFEDMYQELGVPVSGTILVLKWWMTTLPWLTLGAVFALLPVSILLVVLTRQRPQWWEKIRQLIPGWKLLRQFRTGFFCELLQMLLQAGIPISDALNELSEYKHPQWFREQCQRIEQKILSGMTLQKSFAGNWDPLLSWMLVWAEQTGDLETACERVHVGAEKLFLTQVARWGKILEPSLLLMMGALVALTMYSLFVPMYDLTTVISTAGV